MIAIHEAVLPSFQLPNLSISLISQLIGPAFTIALLGAIMKNVLAAPQPPLCTSKG